MDGREITDEYYRYGYQGQYSEEDAATGWNNFKLRMYDARFGRWLSPDPYGQFASPYVGMGNNPVSYVDPDGGLCCGDEALKAFIAAGGTVLDEVVITATRLSATSLAPVARTILQDGIKTWTSKGLMIEPKVDPYQPTDAQLRRWNSSSADTSIPKPDTSPLTSFLAKEPGFAESLIPIWGSGREAAAAFPKVTTGRGQPTRCWQYRTCSW